MAKGANQRQRAKRALKANQGNLIKASYGKASPANPLPNAPKEGELQKDTVPASMRKMMELMAQSRQQNSKGGAALPAGTVVIQSAAARRNKFKSFTSEPVMAPESDSESDLGSSLSGSDDGGEDDEGEESDDEGEEGDHGEGSEEGEQEKGKKGKQVPAGKAAAAAAAAAATDSKGTKAGRKNLPDTSLGKGKGSVWDIVEVKKPLKASKKEYLKRRALKKKPGGGREPDIDAQEEANRKDHIAFGETSSAPLDVHLKRRHWMKERTVADRCKDIFVRQMAQANEAMVSGGGRCEAGGEEAEAGVGRGRTGTEAVAGGKAEGGAGGRATLDSLAQLVKAKPAYHTLA
ncbi:MAG: hypothetical protein WDW36_005213 [Sanguina aurantia]